MDMCWFMSITFLCSPKHIAAIRMDQLRNDEKRILRRVCVLAMIWILSCMTAFYIGMNHQEKNALDALDELWNRLKGNIPDGRWPAARLLREIMEKTISFIRLLRLWTGREMTMTSTDCRRTQRDKMWYANDIAPCPKYFGRINWIKGTHLIIPIVTYLLRMNWKHLI